jgi:uncharacterized membrane protein
MSRSLSSSTRQVVWLAWTVLLLQQVSDAWIHQLPWILWLGKLLPLLIFVPGMRKDNLRSFIWLCFVCLLYFIAMVERLFAQPGSWLAIIGTIAVVVLFTSAMLYVRWRARELRAVDALQIEAGE